MESKITAPTWAEINLDNIKFNLENIKKLLKKDTKICTVLKANAYGHGAVKIAQFLQNKDVDYFAVARLEEALELRQNNIKVPILCLGYVPEQSLELAVDNDIALTIYSTEMANKLNNICKFKNKKAIVHIKIDTGMTRIGFKVNKLTIKEISDIYNLEYIEIEGIYTHLAMADEEDKTFTYNQIDNFNLVVKGLETEGINISIKHLSNSAATMDLPNLDFNMVRCGIVLYGHYPSEEVKKENLPLKPAMTLKTTIAHIKDVEEGVGISYGHKYKSSSVEKIATIPIGYADGFTRIQKTPKAIIKGELFDIVGRICMDQCMIKIDKNIDIKTGDEVIIFGEEVRTVENIANELGTINYEVLCMISRRVDRVYMERNAILQVDSYLVK